MARRPRSASLETRAGRLRLPVQRKPHAFTTIAPGIALAYRRNQGAGRWVVRCADGRGGAWTKAFGIADDYEESDAERVLTFWEAQDKARALARGKDEDSGRPGTVAEAIDDYEADLVVRGGAVVNAQRLRRLLPPAILSKPIALLSTKELRRFRDGLAASMKRASVNRVLKPLKAALTLAADHDPERIGNRQAWRIGLAALKDSANPNNIVLSDDEIRSLVVASYEVDEALGLLVEVLAVTGARISQAARLLVGDVLSNSHDSLAMPSAKKGRGEKKISRVPVPIPVALAARLRTAAGGRGAGEALLLRSDGKSWEPHKADHRRPFMAAVAKAGLDPKVVTSYALRHSHITRSLLRGVPIRVVAALHDSSVQMVEATYSKHIASHGDELARAVMLDLDPPAGNVVPLPGRRA
jgi:integrase